MGKIKGFLDHTRSLPNLSDPAVRVANWDEFHTALPPDELARQGSRCMNCGIPFCHNGTNAYGQLSGCPVNNLIPEWNDLVYRGKWHEAFARLSLTNNFPEFTGRVCPAPCETACVLGINDDPVNIKEIEGSIIDRAFAEGWVRVRSVSSRSDIKIAVVGSGPAGLACADELNQNGHNVTVFEKDDRIGGLLMYGIPNMKLDKAIVQRRVDLLAAEGVEFRTNTVIGDDIGYDTLLADHDYIVLCCGAPKPRDLNIPGRQFTGIYFAMDFLTDATNSVLDDAYLRRFDLRSKDVVVIGGGDTGTDCVATAIRQGCRSLVQFEITPRPRERNATHDSWLGTVRTFKTDYGQAEAAAIFGADPREFSIATTRFVGGSDQNLIGVETKSVAADDTESTKRVWPADTVLLALGFTGGADDSFVSKMGIKVDANNTIVVDKNKRTNLERVYAAGDCERGQSLVVWAIADGRRAAKGVVDAISRSV